MNLDRLLLLLTEYYIQKRPLHTLIITKGELMELSQVVTIIDKVLKT